jgi:hypothetical protein
MPSERNVTHRQAIAGGLNLDLAIRGRLHGRDKIGTRAIFDGADDFTSVTRDVSKACMSASSTL